MGARYGDGRPKDKNYKSYHGKFARKLTRAATVRLSQVVGHEQAERIHKIVKLILVPDLIYSTFMVAFFGIRLNTNRTELDNLREIHQTFHNLAQFNLVFYLLAVLVILIELLTVKCVAANFFKFMF